MPRKKSKVPSYSLHKASQQPVCRIEGRDVYLGKYGSPESYERYERAIAEWRAAQAAQSAVSTVPLRRQSNDGNREFV